MDQASMCSTYRKNNRYCRIGGRSTRRATAHITKQQAMMESACNLTACWLLEPAYRLQRVTYIIIISPNTHLRSDGKQQNPDPHAATCCKIIFPYGELQTASSTILS